MVGRGGRISEQRIDMWGPLLLHHVDKSGPLCRIRRWHVGGAVQLFVVFNLPCSEIVRKVEIRLPGKGNSNSHGARPV